MKIEAINLDQIFASDEEDESQEVSMECTPKEINLVICQCRDWFIWLLLFLFACCCFVFVFGFVFFCLFFLMFIYFISFLLWW